MSTVVPQLSVGSFPLTHKCHFCPFEPTTWTAEARLPWYVEFLYIPESYSLTAMTRFSESRPLSHTRNHWSWPWTSCSGGLSCGNNRIYPLLNWRSSQFPECIQRLPMLRRVMWTVQTVYCLFNRSEPFKFPNNSSRSAGTLFNHLRLGVSLTRFFLQCTGWRGSTDCRIHAVPGWGASHVWQESCQYKCQQVFLWGYLTAFGSNNFL